MVAPESDMLPAWLDYQRATLLWKCAGVGPSDMVRQGVPPSTLTLLGLVRHMTLVEWSWFEKVFVGRTVAAPIDCDVDRDADFNDVDPARVEADLAAFATQCDISRGVVSSAESLDQIAANARDEISLRWILIHMVEEYARHNGHADFLRELIDGAVGE